ncbi:hypothetical protein LTR78_003228 [Recurvomyces mirabilis]|uniref:OPT superfamily oligopeptide transporter n=1 Tax=Recurvomyces mirabilis TaxID=574656 RepID=A0AAE0WSI2_9PEZI|nr:hypothetical protein LTR78_003228 [Recurvomyces mirabilis]KAK5156954.1 hypothetical protein LTS14_004471 [Recurvomyces mirabilis]
MASQRPGFLRTNTEQHGGPSIELGEIDPKKSHGSPEFHDADEKVGTTMDVEPAYDDAPPEYEDAGDGFHKVTAPVETAKDLVTQVLHVDDDPTLNPYTFRVFFLGVGLSIFGSVLQEIFYFKPQTIYVSVVFLCVIGYVLGEVMAAAIPRKGVLRYLNPHPFNMKEHAAITLMASAAAQTATATEALAAQQLFYGGYPSRAAGIFVVLSSQLIGYGLAGLLRDVLVYPTKMLWPINLPVATLLETLHRDKVETRRRLKIFYIVFICIFVWEAFPEYIFTVLTGFSVFCLADQNNLVFTNLFGGASGNEGLGFLSTGTILQGSVSVNTQINQLVGICGCYILFMAVYYGNIWRSYDFPFLSQELLDGSSNSTNYVTWNQSAVLTADFLIDQDALKAQGIPYLTGSYIVYLITSNMGLTAALTHMFIWNRDDIRAGWAWAKPANLKRLLRADTWKFWQRGETPEERFARKQNDPDLDPHYKLMMRNLYKETPMWWWGAVVIISWVAGVAALYGMRSTLPWWGFLISTILTSIFLLFFGAQMGITGFQFNTQPICQMLAGYMFPGRPLANFYFTCYTYNSLQMGQLLAKDLKLAQYAHLPPMCTFIVQISGCLVGALFNWVMMVTIVENQATILTSIQGSNIWSGQNIQQFNTLAIAWSIADDMFSVGARYQWVTLSFLVGFVAPIPLWLAYRYTKWWPFEYFNTSIILWYFGNLFVGINSSLTSFFIIGIVAQYYIRKYRPLASQLNFLSIFRLCSPIL